MQVVQGMNDLVRGGNIVQLWDAVLLMHSPTGPRTCFGTGETLSPCSICRAGAILHTSRRAQRAGAIRPSQSRGMSPCAICPRGREGMMTEKECWRWVAGFLDARIRIVEETKCPEVAKELRQMKMIFESKGRKP